MCPRGEIVVPERNLSAEILRGPDGAEFSHRLELEPPGARTAERPCVA